MPIYFEKRPRGEDETVLAIYGTKEDYAQLVDDLKERLALQALYRKPDENLRVPNLKSSSLDDVGFYLVSKEEALNLQHSFRKRKVLLRIVWFLFLLAFICALLFAPTLG